MLFVFYVVSVTSANAALNSRLWALRARSVLGSVRESVPENRGVRESVQKVSRECLRSVKKVSGHSGDTLGTPFGHSGARGLKGPRDIPPDTLSDTPIFGDTLSNAPRDTPEASCRGLGVNRSLEKSSDVSDVFYFFFLLGWGKEEAPEEAARGWFLIENRGRGGITRGGGVGGGRRRGGRLWGWGGLSIFCAGPKLSPREKSLTGSWKTVLTVPVSVRFLRHNF